MTETKLIHDKMSTNGEDPVLADITNNMAISTLNEKQAQRVKDANWGEPTKFDYESYNAGSREERQAVAAAQEGPEWAATATKYEWSDEYGDVGPAHPQLERLLFGDETKMEKGEELAK